MNWHSDSLESLDGFSLPNNYFTLLPLLTSPTTTSTTINMVFDFHAFSHQLNYHPKRGEGA